MNQFKFSGEGAGLRSNQGEIIRLPMGASGTDTISPDVNDAQSAFFSCSFNSIGQFQRWILRGGGFLLLLNANGDIELRLTDGPDSSSPNATNIVSKAGLENQGVFISANKLHSFYIYYEGRTASEQSPTIYIDGVKINWTSQAAGNYSRGYLIYPKAFGGHNTASYSDMVVYELLLFNFKINANTADGGLSAAQVAILHNAGRGVDITRRKTEYKRVRRHFIFSSRCYNSENSRWAAIETSGKIAGFCTAFSSSFRADYSLTDLLVFDGIDDKILTGQKYLDYTDNFTYEVEVVPFFPVALGQNSQIVYNPNTARMFLDGDPGAYSTPNNNCAAPYAMIGTNGVSFGFQGSKQPFNNLYFVESCYFAYSFPPNTLVKVGMRLQNRVPSLWINGVLRATGAILDSVMPIRPGLEICQTFRKAGASLQYGGQVRNMSVWSIARTDAEMASAIPSGGYSGTESGLEQYWTMQRVNVQGAPDSKSEILLDKTVFGRHGLMQNFVLNPASVPFKNRVGKRIYS